MSTTAPTGNDDEQIEELQRFLGDYYEDAIARTATTDQKGVEIDWMDLFRFNQTFAHDYLDHPDEAHDRLERALQTYPLPIDGSSPPDEATVEVVNASGDAKMVGDTRADDISDVITLTGQVTKRTGVKPKLETGAFVCQRCRSINRVPQPDDGFVEPHECEGCERAGPFHINESQSNYVDYQKIRLQRPPEKTDGGSSEVVDIYAEESLVGRIDAGDRVEATGVVRLQDGGNETSVGDYYIETRGMEVEETDFEDIDTEEYEELIAEVSEGEALPVLRESLAPTIHGNDTIKEALVLQMAGGVRGELPNGKSRRGDTHILLLGDPGVGKSELLGAVADAAPRGVKGSGKSVSAAGLTAAAVQSDFDDGGWTLEAGALVLADGGIACIDEIDKMDEEDRNGLHSALEQQEVNVSKAGINATMMTRTSLLAAGNPRYGRFDQYEPIGEQIDLDPALISRFDLIFPIDDDPDEDTDRAIAQHIIEGRDAANRGSAGQDLTDEQKQTFDEVLEDDEIRAYIAFARQNVTPTWDDELVKERLEDYYTNLRLANDDEEDAAVPVTARKVPAVMRLAEASARIELRGTVSEDDVERAIQLVGDMMAKLGIDPESGNFDADRINTGTTKSQHDRRKAILAIIEDLHDAGEAGAPVEDIHDLAKQRDITRKKADRAIDHWKGKGEIYEPIEGEYRMS